MDSLKPSPYICGIQRQTTALGHNTHTMNNQPNPTEVYNDYLNPANAYEAGGVSYQNAWVEGKAIADKAKRIDNACAAFAWVGSLAVFAFTLYCATL